MASRSRPYRMEGIITTSSSFVRLLFVIACVHGDESATAKEWRPSRVDFIIVGAGSAGSVVAARLTEDPGTYVLLLEAGGTPDPGSEVPAWAPKYWGPNIPMDWFFRTEPQTNACFALENHQCHWSRGKGLGGSSSINAMIYARGNRRDYQLWEDHGNEGWGFDDLLPYFLKMEDYQVPQTKQDAKYHARNGPTTVTRPSFHTPIANAFLEGGAELGYHLTDYNAIFQTGFMQPVFNVRNGSRCGTFVAYLKPALERKNLHVVMDAFVTKITFDDRKVASGVNFEHEGELWWARANKEVIVSAGTVSTPQILMLSGIGPRETLNQFKLINQWFPTI